MSKQILVVEDEERIAHLLRDYLAQAGFAVHCLYTGTPVVTWVKSNNPDLVLLDQMLPEKNGMDILRELREFSSIPVIMATAKTEEIDRLLGLEYGADDYVCKPFSFREVVARVKAVLRRGREPHEDNPSSSSAVLMDEARFCAMICGKSINLTVIEFKLLQILSQNPGRIFSRDHLMDHIYSDGRVVSDRTIDSHIRKLRCKIADLHPDKEFIHSVYSAGYKFEMVYNG